MDNEKPMFVHHYVCDVCTESFYRVHDSDSLHWDVCPACACEDNGPVEITEFPHEG